MTALKGIIAPFTTPFKANGEIDLTLIKPQVDWLIENGVHGLAAGGSTGEGHALSRHEYLSLMTETASSINGRVPLVAGIIAMIIGLLLSPTIIVSPKDIFLGFLAGFFQLGFGFIFITIGARSTPAAFVGIIMLTEAVLGPFWAWMFVNENLPLTVLIGGSIVITAVVIQFFDKFIK